MRKEVCCSSKIERGVCINVSIKKMKMIKDSGTGPVRGRNTPSASAKVALEM